MKKFQLYILALFLLNLVLSCEKIEIPALPSDEGEEKRETDKGDGKVDSTWQSALYGWGYNCTIDVTSGEIVDSSSVEYVDTMCVTGDGTENNPYTAYDFVKGVLYARMSAEQISIDNVWLRGYIVGYVQGRNMQSVMFGTGNVATNIIVGDSPKENNYSCCVPIQLPTKIRASLNLRDNPSLIGKRVVVCGTATRYMGVFGIKNTKCYVRE